MPDPAKPLARMRNSVYREVVVGGLERSEKKKARHFCQAFV